ncbi:MAG: helix-turn-helix transcriptional regulator, partial [Eubacterium ramulus]
FKCFTVLSGGPRMARIIDTETNNLIGEKVKKLRKEKHMSQQQLSDGFQNHGNLYLPRFCFQN